MPFTLQLLHASDLEGGVDAITRAPNFAAITDALRASFSDSTLLLSAGDNSIPGPFFNAAGDQAAFRDSGVFNNTYNQLFNLPRDVDANGTDDSYAGLREGGGRVDISIMNLLGFDAAALGNHEFDSGTSILAGYLAPDFRSSGLQDDRWVGSQFPFLSANLDFSNDDNLSSLFTSDILTSTSFASGPSESLAGTIGPKIAQASIIERGAEKIGVVGAVTPLLAQISSPGSTSLVGPTSNDMAALAAVLQPVIDNVIAQGVNKVILVSHLQQIALEKELIGLLSGVDIVVAGGSDTLQADSEDVSRGLNPGDSAAENYPFITTNKDGDAAVVVSTDGEYSYVGRLVVTFDDNGVLETNTIDSNVSGAFATTDEGVVALAGSLDAAFAAGTAAAEVKALTGAVQSVVTVQDGNVFGSTDVFLEGRREEIRTQETNLGNLTADANLAIARQFDPAVAVSIKNGGGIRDLIGTVDEVSSGVFAELPPQANSLSGKAEGQVSQLDITNALRFNNELTVMTLTADQLKQAVEHAVSATAEGATPGQFPQIGGMRFSFDPNADANARVQSLAIIDDNGAVVDSVVENGAVVGASDRPIKIVTLNFLADGGDGYPFPDFVAADSGFANRTDLTSVLTEPGAATFAGAGTEQDALAEFLSSNFASNGFVEHDVAPKLDERIQILGERPDTVSVADPVYRYLNSETGGHLFSASQAEGNPLLENTAFTFEGPAFGAAHAGLVNAVEVVRFFDSETKAHFYSADPNEIAHVDGLSNFTREGTAFFALTDAAEGTVPVFRLFNPDSKLFFYTANTEERDLLTGESGGFALQGTAFHLFDL